MHTGMHTRVPAYPVHVPGMVAFGVRSEEAFTCQLGKSYWIATGAMRSGAAAAAAAALVLSCGFVLYATQYDSQAQALFRQHQVESPNLQ